MRRRGRGERTPIYAEVNVVSLIDLMMLLMVIFMITAPIMQGGVDLTLPKAEAKAVESKGGMVVSVTREGHGQWRRAGARRYDRLPDAAAHQCLHEHARPESVGIAEIEVGRHGRAKQVGIDAVRMRVGALPKFPSNALNYNLTWSTAGVINEYCQPCEAIVGGRPANVPPLEELEHFALDGIQYEAFNTSGGLGTLCTTLEGKVRNLNYRTIRYPGHRDAMKLLLQDLRLAERPAVLADVLENAIRELPVELI